MPETCELPRTMRLTIVLAASLLAVSPLHAGVLTSATALADLLLTEVSSSSSDFTGLTISVNDDLQALEAVVGDVDSTPDGAVTIIDDPLGIGVGVDLSIAASVVGEARNGMVEQDVLAFAILEVFNGTSDAVSLGFAFDYLLNADVDSNTGFAGHALADATLSLVDFINDDMVAAVAAELESGPLSDSLDGLVELTYRLAPGDTLLLELMVNAFGSAAQVTEPPLWILLTSGLLAIGGRRRGRQSTIEVETLWRR